MARRGNMRRTFWGPRIIKTRRDTSPVNPTDPDELVPPAGYIILDEDNFVLREDGFILMEVI